MDAELRQALEQLGGSFTGRLDKMHSEIRDEMTGFQEQLDRVETRVNRPGQGGGGDRAAGDLTAERKAMAMFARTGDESAFAQLRQNVMSTDSDPDGGYLVSPAVSTGMTKKLFDLSPVKRLARTEVITSGESWVEPVDFDDIGVTFVGERQARPETTGPKLKMLTIPVSECYSLVKATQRMRDSVPDLGAWLQGKQEDKFARSLGAYYVTGDSVLQPEGFLSVPIVSTPDATREWGQLQYVPSGAATTITADSLRDLAWSLRAPYRRQNPVFLMNSNTANACDKLKTGDG